MSVLSEEKIKDLIEKGELIVKGKKEIKINPTSVDLHLGNKFTCFKYSDQHVVDLKNFKNPIYFERLLPDGRKMIGHLFTDEYVGEEPFTIHPKDTVFGVTEEYIQLPENVGARFYPKSEIVRAGLIVFSASGWAQWIDPGFRGDIFIGMHNIAWLPIKVYPGMNIGRLVFEKVE